MMLPNDVEYGRTATFDENTVPEKLLKDHNLKAGAWGLLVVQEGSLELVSDSRTQRVQAGEGTYVLRSADGGGGMGTADGTTDRASEHPSDEETQVVSC